MESMKDVMLDLETLGNGKNACIVQIGACYFDRMTGEIGNTFKVNIDPTSSVKSGADIDAETVMWWMKQTDEARQSILVPGIEIENAIHRLNIFLEQANAIWSHATFDFVIVTETFKRLDIKPKFSYRSARDLRTLVDLGKINTKKFTREGTHHDALDDCKFQVKYAVDCINSINNDNK